MKTFVSLLDLLRDLIAIPSVSPEGEAGGTRPGEQALAEYLAEMLRGAGAEVSLTPVQPGRPNLVARFASGRPQAPTVAFVPHLDTVGVAGMSVAPFAAELRGGRVYGRGACDTKGPLAAALWALLRHARDGGIRSSAVDWVFAATMGEEELSTGATALCAAGFRADFALVLEPTSMQAVRAAKGVLRAHVEASGRACHASTPEKGVNAIYRLLPFLNSCQHALAPAFAAARHPDLGGASLNLAVVEGGAELNIVPDRARAGLDIRTHPNLTNELALSRLREAAGELAVRVHRSGPPFALDAGHPWLARLAPFCAGFGAAPWFSDANVLNAHGIPAVAIGPGSIAQAHTRDEYIEVAELESGASAFSSFIETVSRGTGA